MFIKIVHLHLTSIFPIIVVVRVLDFQCKSPGCKTAGWLQGQRSLSFCSGQLNEYQELLGAEW